MTFGLRSFVLILLLPLFAAAAEPVSDSSQRLALFLASLAPPSEQPMPFVERRMSSLLAEPLELRGELQIGKDGTIDRHVLAPVEERMRINATSLTLERDGRTRTVELRRDAGWQAFHSGISGLLNRDQAALERVFSIQLEETASGWRLELHPRRSRSSNPISLVRAEGFGPDLFRLRLEFGSAEWQEIDFVRPGS